jgi:tRNA G10  N-methylase Trm11
MGTESRMVLMHPDDVPVPPTSQWTVEEKHTIYVHKRLTRAISVLRRR